MVLFREKAGTLPEILHLNRAAIRAGIVQQSNGV